jgi:putative ABC transport system substrate-binding protein
MRIILTSAARLEQQRQQELRELGYVERQNYAIEYRSADGRLERFADLAAELVRLKVDLIVTRGTTGALAAKNATRTIPIVMATSGDPVGAGLVASLARPGGNVTGLSSINAELVGKRLGLLKEAIPGIARIAVVLNLSNPTLGTQRKQIEVAARSLGFQTQFLDVRKPGDLGRAFDTAVKQRADAVHVGLDFLAQSNLGRIVDLAAKHRLPTIYSTRDFVDAGGLMAYGVSRLEMYRHAGTYVDKILKGANSSISCPAGRRAASCWGVGMASRCRWIGIPLRTQHQPSGHPQYLVGNERQTEDRARTRVSLARHLFRPAGAERAFPAGLRRARRSCIRDSAS